MLPCPSKSQQELRPAHARVAHLRPCRQPHLPLALARAADVTMVLRPQRCTFESERPVLCGCCGGGDGPCKHAHARPALPAQEHTPRVLTQVDGVTLGWLPCRAGARYACPTGQREVEEGLRASPLPQTSRSALLLCPARGTALRVSSCLREVAVSSAAPAQTTSPWPRLMFSPRGPSLFAW